MKLLTKKETDLIFDNMTQLNLGVMDKERFCIAVNAIFMDPTILQKLKKRVVKIKEKLDKTI